MIVKKYYKTAQERNDDVYIMADNGYMLIKFNGGVDNEPLYAEYELIEVKDNGVK